MLIWGVLRYGLRCTLVSILRNTLGPYSTSVDFTSATFMSLTAAVAVATSLAVAIAFYTGRRRDAKGSFPPGPPPKFLIGNALDFNPLHAWDTFIEWKATYGE